MLMASPSHNRAVQMGSAAVCTSISDSMLILFECAGAARLPGFHACVGGGGERQTPEWYTEKGEVASRGCGTRSW